MTGFNSKRMMAREAETLNERIKELVKQATTIEEHKWGVSYDNFDKEKFAELIIRECADIASINQFQYDAVGNYVKKHFGVEE
jgi:hypothetical protein